MRTLWTAALLAGCCLPGAANAKPAGAIDCAVQGLSAKQRADVGVALIDDTRGDVVVRANEIIGKPAGACAKANRWTEAQTDTAITWSVWDLMGAEAQRRSGLSAADLTIMRAYVDEDPTRIDGLDHFTTAQFSQIIAALRQRGAHLHDAGKDTERELGFLLMLGEMKLQESHFAGS